MQTRYYSLLDILRFLAALFVMLFHYFSSNLQEINLGGLNFFTDFILVFKSIFITLINHGYLGVELFFIISGFVIYNSLKDKKEEDSSSHNRALDWKAYTWSRFLRLYPLFWILCTITYVMTIFMAPSHLPFYKYLLNLFIINNGQTANMIDGSYWTLTIEILFYIYIGLFAYIAGRKNIIYFFTMWLLYSFVAYTFGFSELLISKLLLVRYAPYFVYGGALAILMQSIKKIKNIILPISLMLASIYMTKYISVHLVAIDKAHTMTNKFGIFNGVNQIFIYCIFALATLFTFLSLYIKNKTLIGYLQIIGLATYPLYLMHQRIGSMIIELYTDFGAVDKYSISITIAIVLVAIYIGIVDKSLRAFLSSLVGRSRMRGLSG